jgi:hypothetical protein
MNDPDPNPNGGGEMGGCVAVVFALLSIAFITGAIVICHFNL